ncbi:hypothetical protein ENHYD8BJ_80099 [Enhydrobacter sp. 8BJ]|nr:hypothetical protein ENHYD8BJ_80099 [Enhydrobacter sp. 8BJ]
MAISIAAGSWTTTFSPDILLPLSSASLFSSICFIRLPCLSLKRILLLEYSVYANLTKMWQAMRDSNPQHSVLETDALPIELIAYVEFEYYSEFFFECNTFYSFLRF